MGAGASSSPLPTSVEEALAAGHSQAEIDAYMAEHPQRRPTLAASKSRFDRAASLEARVEGQLRRGGIAALAFSRKPSGLKIQKSVGPKPVVPNRRGTVNTLELFRQAQMVSTSMVDKVESLHVTWLVTLSNTDSNSMVLDTAMSLRKGGDFLSCMHSFVRSDEMVPAGSKAKSTANLKSTWETKLMTSLPASKFHLDLKERDPEASVKDHVVSYAKNFAAEVSSTPIMCVGVREPRSATAAAQHLDDTNVLGSTTDLVLHEIHVPCCFVKKATAPHAARTFLIAIDGTYRSFHAYELAMAIMKPRDKVVIFSVFDPDDQGLAADIKHDTIEVHHRDDGQKAMEEITDLMAFYNHDMEDRGLIDFSCQYEANDPTRPISQQIIDYSEREDVAADYIVVGQRPYVGEVPMTSERLARDCSCNLIIFKSSAGSDEAVSVLEGDDSLKQVAEE